MVGRDPIRFGTGDFDNPGRKATLLGDRQREREDNARRMGDVAARLIWGGGVGDSPLRTSSSFGTKFVFCATFCCAGLDSVERE